MYQAIDVQIVEGDKQPKIGEARNAACVDFAHFVLHVIGFEPVFYAFAGLVGAAFGVRGVRAQALPRIHLVFFTQ